MDLSLNTRPLNGWLRPLVRPLVCLLLGVTALAAHPAIAREPLFAPPQLAPSALVASSSEAPVTALAQRASAPADSRTFAPPQPAALEDEVLLVSTRVVGAACDGAQLERALVCERLVQRDGRVAWEQTDWRATLGSARPTIVYVHGNRVEEGKDRQQGLEVYRALKAQADLSGPVRLVIWSWPSTKLRRPVKDYVVKAHLTHPAAWQLAWWIDRLPLETPVALVGYSYGTRVVTGATQLLAGGTLGSLALPERHHPERPPVRAALIAAAFDADWIEPGAFYGRSVAKLERLVLATNRLDPAMRFYHLSNGRRRIDALGKQGVEPSPSLGELVSRMRQLDFTPEVGRSHALSDYLQAHAQMQALWKAVLPEGERVARKSR